MYHSIVSQKSETYHLKPPNRTVLSRTGFVKTQQRCVWTISLEKKHELPLSSSFSCAQLDSSNCFSFCSEFHDVAWFNVLAVSRCCAGSRKVCVAFHHCGFWVRREPRCGCARLQRATDTHISHGTTKSAASVTETRPAYRHDEVTLDGAINSLGLLFMAVRGGCQEKGPWEG